MIDVGLGIGKNESFGIDKNLFKTRDERRLAQQIQQREDQAEVSQHLQRVAEKDEVLDVHAESKALETVGSKRDVVAPTVSAEAPSGESSAFKALELRP